MLGQMSSGPTALQDMAASDTPSMAAHIHHIHTSHIAASGGIPHNVSASSAGHQHPNRSQHGSPQYAGSRVVDIARMENSIRQMYNDKLRGSTQAVVNALVTELPRDHVFAQLMSDATTQPFCKVRVGEVVETFLYSVQAHQYHNLASELSKLEFDHYQLTIEFDEMAAAMEQQAQGYEASMAELRSEREQIAVAQQLQMEESQHDVVNKSTQASDAFARGLPKDQTTQTEQADPASRAPGDDDAAAAALLESERLRLELHKHIDALSAAQTLNHQQTLRIESLERDAKEVEASKQDLARAIESLSTENVELRSDLLHNATTTARMRDDLIAMQGEAAAELAALREQASDRDAECASIRLSLDAAHQELAVLGAAHDEAVAAGTKLKEAHSRMVEEMEELRPREAALASAVEDERLHRAGLETSQTTTQGTLGDLLAERARLADELRQEKDRGMESDGQVQQLSTTLSEAKRALAELDARSTELQQHVNELRADAADRDAAAAALRQQLGASKAEFQDASQSLVRAEDRAAAVEQRLRDKDAAHEAQLAMLRAAFTDSAAVLQQELHALRQSTSASQDARRLDESGVEHRLLERLTAAHDEQMRLAQENTELYLNLSASNNRLSALSADLAASEQRFAALQEDHEQLRDVFSVLQARHGRQKASASSAPPSSSPSAGEALSLVDNMSPISHDNRRHYQNHPLDGGSPCRDVSVSACDAPQSAAVDIAVEALMTTLQRHDAAAVREVQAVGAALLSAMEAQRAMQHTNTETSPPPTTAEDASQAVEAQLVPLMHRIEALITMEHDNSVALHASQMQTAAAEAAAASQRAAIHVTYEVLRTVLSVVGGPVAHQPYDDTDSNCPTDSTSERVMSLARDVLQRAVASSTRSSMLRVEVAAAVEGLMERVDASYQTHIDVLVRAHHQCLQDAQQAMHEALQRAVSSEGVDVPPSGNGGPLLLFMQRCIQSVVAGTRARYEPQHRERRDQQCATEPNAPLCQMPTAPRDVSAATKPLHHDAAAQTASLQVSVAATQAEGGRGVADAEHALYHSILDEANQMLHEQRGMEYHLEATKESEQKALAAARRWQATAQELEALLDDEYAVVGDLREALARLKQDVASSQALFNAQMGRLHGQYHAVSRRCIQEEQRNAVLHERCVTKEKRIGMLERQATSFVGAAAATQQRASQSPAASVGGRQTFFSPLSTNSSRPSPQPHQLSPMWWGRGASAGTVMPPHHTAAPRDGGTLIDRNKVGPATMRAGTHEDNEGSPSGLSPSPIPPVFEDVR